MYLLLICLATSLDVERKFANENECEKSKRMAARTFRLFMRAFSRLKQSETSIHQKILEPSSIWSAGEHMLVGMSKSIQVPVLL